MGALSWHAKRTNGRDQTRPSSLKGRPHGSLVEEGEVGPPGISSIVPIFEFIAAYPPCPALAPLLFFSCYPAPSGGQWWVQLPLDLLR